jgi:outer membrane protein
MGKNSNLEKGDSMRGGELSGLERTRFFGVARNTATYGCRRPFQLRPTPSLSICLGLILLLVSLPASLASGQTSTMNGDLTTSALQTRQTSASAEGAPLTLTYQDALERAKRFDPQYLSYVTSERVARQDVVQARAALLPSVSSTNQLLMTQGNGVLPSGRYVTNDGIHVYRVWGVMHQSLGAGTLTLDGLKRAQAAAAVARAQEEIALRGLNVTVTKDYYDLVVAERGYAIAQQALNQAKRFLSIAQDLERGGEVAHSDVIKFQLQYNQQEQALREARLAMETARLNLAVLLFPDFNQNFTVVDDLDQATPLPAFHEVRQMGEKNNPQLRAAVEALRQASKDVSLARFAFLPSLGLELDYGIEANSLALRSRTSAFPEAGRLPNMGFFLTATISFPVWDWGALHSKLRQANYRREQAHGELTFAQRQLLSNLASFYAEAQTAHAEVDSLRQAADLAAESLRLNTLRYRAGEATVLEAVDAENTNTQARNSYAAGLERYRMALATLQTLTGSF